MGYRIAESFELLVGHFQFVGAFFYDGFQVVEQGNVAVCNIGRFGKGLDQLYLFFVRGVMGIPIAADGKPRIFKVGREYGQALNVCFFVQFYGDSFIGKDISYDSGFFVEQYPAGDTVVDGEFAAFPQGGVGIFFHIPAIVRVAQNKGCSPGLYQLTGGIGNNLLQQFQVVGPG